MKETGQNLTFTNRHTAEQQERHFEDGSAASWQYKWWGLSRLSAVRPTMHHSKPTKLASDSWSKGRNINKSNWIYG